MSLVDMAMAALKFDKAGLASTANNEDDTMPAMILIFLQSIVAFVMAMIFNESTSPIPLGDLAVGVFAMGMISLVVSLIMTLLLGVLLSFVIRMFGGQSGTMQVLRIVGATSVWGTIGTILSFAGLSWIFAIIGFFALLFGISAYSGKGMFMVFIAMIVTYILLGIIIMVLVVGVLATLLTVA